MKPLCLILLFQCCILLPSWSQGEIDLSLEIFARGLANPTDIAHAGDERLFIVEKAGRIKIVDSNGEVQNDPFLDISGKVNDRASERGLLGLAFHPDYTQNGYFFVNYTNADGHTIVSRYSVDNGNPNQAAPNSEKIIIQIDQPRSNHNGGDINFGPDGYLYIGMGDGGAAADPWNNSQNATELLGKMLRIDVDTEDMPYLIPSDNPYFGISTTRNEIWAFGVRNPWRFSFDREGNMWTADVGQDTWEEINFQPADSPGGENYGWSCLEGNETYIANRCTLDSSDYTYPVFIYRNNFSDGCSVTGGYRYQGCTYPRLYDQYIFTDYCTGKFWATWKCPTDTCALPFETQEVANLQDQQFVSFGEDHDGELYVAAIGLGNIYRVIETNEVFEAPTIDSTDQGLISNANYAAYQWYLDGDPINGATGPSIVPQMLGTYQLEAFSAAGCSKISNEIVVTDLNSLSSPSLSNKVWVFPNPSESVTHLRWDEKLSVQSLEMYAPQGQLLRIFSPETPSGAVVDISGLNTGIYFLKIKTNEGTVVKKLKKN
jgi:glucose/arabinose dehydrogenase